MDLAEEGIPVRSSAGRTRRVVAEGSPVVAEGSPVAAAGIPVVGEGIVGDNLVAVAGTPVEGRRAVVGIPAAVPRSQVDRTPAVDTPAGVAAVARMPVVPAGTAAVAGVADTVALRERLAVVPAPAHRPLQPDVRSRGHTAEL